MYQYEMNFQKILQTRESKTINIHHQWKVLQELKIFSTVNANSLAVDTIPTVEL